MRTEPSHQIEGKSSAPGPSRRHFLSELIEADQSAGRNGGEVVTRFPPEPNGYLHIGHAKSICLNFGLARDFGGSCHLRMDDTNPVTEDTDYVEAIQRDVAWLGFAWSGEVRYASDYFEQMYLCAERLIEQGDAYVDEQNVEQIREGRGSFERPGTDSPWRGRAKQESLALFRRMRAGEFGDGSLVLRAKINMTHPNVVMRDPLLYRIRHAHHHRSGDLWCIYPMYDFAHPLEDAIEGITHSICTLEFESNRELYDWVLDHLGPWLPRPRQHEFARLGLEYTIVSKRKLLQLVEEGHVSGWDDPRMPTIAGLRRRGVSPQALRDFADLIGVAKNNSLVDIGKLEYCIRQDVERQAPRALAVLRPLPVTLTTWPEAHSETLPLAWWPGEPERGVRELRMGRKLFIDREDFAESPPKGWKRLAPGGEVRLIGAYFIRCDEVLRGEDGEIVELRCSHDPATRGGEALDGRSPDGTLQWVDAASGLVTPVRLYDRLFAVPQPDADAAVDFRSHLNPQSLVVCADAVVEAALASAEPGSRYQFVRLGYFFADPVASQPGAPVWNRTISLRDTWQAAAQAAGKPREELRAGKKREATKTEATPGRKSRAEHRNELRAATPELASRHDRYLRDMGLTADEADLLTGDLELAQYFDAASPLAAPASIARWLLNDLLGLTRDRSLSTLALDGVTFGHFVALADSGKVAPQAAKTLLGHLVEHGGDPSRLVEQLDLAKVADPDTLAKAVAEVLAAHAAEVARYRAGEQKLAGVFIGAVMRQVRGADPVAVRKVLAEQLG